MNRIELKDKLDALGVKPNRYSLYGELISDSVVLFENYQVWQVFYFDERGGRNNEKEFESENEACHYIYDLLYESKKIEDKFKLNK